MLQVVTKRSIFFLGICLFALMLQAQPTSADWLNSNAIPIEDATAITEPELFAAKMPEGFKNARVFGFGEASHHGKEFFDIKAKFFKHLVQHQGVTLFIMEESYQAERATNIWLAGGEGDAKSVMATFGQGIWYRQEFVDLLQWMHDYNVGKPTEKQVKFYGMDNQFGHGINKRLRKYVSDNKLPIDEALLVVADTCANAQLKAGGIRKWSDTNLPKLKSIQQVLKAQEAELAGKDAATYNDMMRALHYLMRYTTFLQETYSQNRDRDMFENVSQIMGMNGSQSKAFIWAHNEHVNKQELYGSPRLKSLGRLLKDNYKNDYYSVGFDFGGGTLPGVSVRNGKNVGWKFETLDNPFEKTPAETLMQANADIYFLSMDKASSEPSKVFISFRKQLMIGGPGFDAANPYFYKRKIADSFDGLIFVKRISPSTPLGY